MLAVRACVRLAGRQPGRTGTATASLLGRGLRAHRPRNSRALLSANCFVSDRRSIELAIDLHGRSIDLAIMLAGDRRGKQTDQEQQQLASRQGGGHVCRGP
jgi:hypothetical protein